MIHFDPYIQTYYKPNHSASQGLVPLSDKFLIHDQKQPQSSVISSYSREKIMGETKSKYLENFEIQPMKTISKIQVMEDRTIYHPPLPNTNDKEILKIYDRGKQPVYSCSVFNMKTTKWETADVFYNEEDEEHNFLAYNMSGKFLGRIKVLKYCFMEDGEFGCPAMIFQSDSISKYGNEEKFVTKIEIKDLKIEVKDTYKFTGYNLMKVAMQKFHEAECRVDLYAAWNSPLFYWKLGFRPNTKENFEKIAAQVLEGPTSKDFGNIKMHLPNWASTAWIEELKQNPVKSINGS